MDMEIINGIIIDKNYNYVLGLDVSTKCIGIALFEDKDGVGNLKLLHQNFLKKLVFLKKSF
jgi:hypothetical protein